MSFDSFKSVIYKLFVYKSYIYIYIYIYIYRIWHYITYKHWYTIKPNQSIKEICGPQGGLCWKINFIWSISMRVYWSAYKLFSWRSSTGLLIGQFLYFVYITQLICNSNFQKFKCWKRIKNLLDFEFYIWKLCLLNIENIIWIKF